ncbi:cofactor-independent phosphoglycerate mutase [Petrocella sp. FN5]|uniref:cofactor-independent phosphoglycerate mutase n=1 Tax=Petrocella sp. FN5 TaxID=3032002 RepID=UPI0023DC9F4A|nr:cofactor-independent phosphoglycerate mutase [Petrocella sp. FN5]MDF1615975.1 cofactor-independent phosphoglycerate mutase [Petrocella sp. FN5]
MKYVVILGDGMADRPIERLGNKTPLQVAKKPNIDALAMQGEVALVDTIPKGMAPGSDTANLSVMGYNPEIYYTGRSPLEAVSMGISMEDDDICFRCNLVTLSEQEPYEDKIMLDHSASEITTEEAGELIAAIDHVFSDTIRKFYPGISYRHALIWKKGSLNVELEPPHNILENRIKDHLPKGDFSDIILEMQKKSYAILNDHPINVDRAKRKLNKANSIWIWGEGTKPSLTSFMEKYGKKGAMVSAVDLLKGIAIASEMTSIDVEGADGSLHTNYEGKVNASLKALKTGHDFVYLHIEAPDECGHRGELENKILAIELIDEKVVKPIVKGLTEMKEPYRILIMPDHPTPVEIRTHTTDPVPYVLYDSRRALEDHLTYDEVMAEKNGVRFEKGHELMGYFLSEE